VTTADRSACVFLVPGDWDSRTGGTLYDRRIVGGLRHAGWSVTLASPGAMFPHPDAAAHAQARAAVEALPDGALVVADGLAFGALPELAEQHAARLRWVALVHHPLALEAGLSPAQQAALQASERRALACARAVVVTSASTAQSLAGYGVAAHRITVVEPGTDPAPPAQGGGAGPLALSLLCVATVTPRKGHTVLLQALAGLQDRPWQLHCVGSLARDAGTAAQVRQAQARLGLAGRVVWHGEVEQAQLQALYAQADLFVLPSFHEGYGMALAEALARGLPIVSCAAGAIVDTVPAQAGVLVPPGDVAALRAALQSLLDDPQRRAALAAGAQAHALRLPDWPQAVRRFAGVLEALA
jgi:glycosyltransferase involved in cell wall biosynthesis